MTCAHCSPSRAVSDRRTRTEPITAADFLRHCMQQPCQLSIRYRERGGFGRAAAEYREAPIAPHGNWYRHAAALGEIFHRSRASLGNCKFILQAEGSDFRTRS